MYDESNMTLATALLVVGLLVGAGVGYYMAPSGTYDDGNYVEPVEQAPIPVGFDWFYYVPYVMGTVTGVWCWTLSDKLGKLKVRILDLERMRR